MYIIFGSVFYSFTYCICNFENTKAVGVHDRVSPKYNHTSTRNQIKPIKQKVALNKEVTDSSSTAGRQAALRCSSSSLPVPAAGQLFHTWLSANVTRLKLKPTIGLKPFRKDQNSCNRESRQTVPQLFVHICLQILKNNTHAAL